MLNLIFLITGILLLIVWGGGIFPNAVYSAAALLAAGAAISALFNKRKVSRRRRILFGIWSALLIWQFVTILPLPAPMRLFLTGSRGELTRAVRDLHEEVQEELSLPSTAPPPCFSLNKAGTLRIAMLLTCMFSAAWLASSLDKNNRKKYLVFLVICGSLIACGGLLAAYFNDPGGKIWWIFETEIKRSYACFGNPNHYGAFLAALCPIITAFALRDIRYHEWERLLLWGSLLALLIAGVIASSSRGAYLILFCSFTITGLLSFRKKNIDMKVGVGIACLACIGLMMIAALTTTSMDKEMRTIKAENFFEFGGRTVLWSQLPSVIADYPVIGLGAEGYRTISPYYLARRSNRYAHHLENSWFQLLADQGILITAVWITGFILLFLSAGKAIKNGNLSSTVAIAASGGIFVMMIHCLYDFPLHIPIYGVVFASLIGLLLPRGNETSESSLYRYFSFTAFLLAVTGVFATYILIGEKISTMDKYDYSEKASRKELLHAMTYAPGMWSNWYYFGLETIKQETTQSYILGDKCLERAVTLDPLNPYAWRHLARVRKSLGLLEEAEEAFEHYLSLRPERYRDRDRKRWQQEK